MNPLLQLLAALQGPAMAQDRGVELNFNQPAQQQQAQVPTPERLDFERKIAVNQVNPIKPYQKTEEDRVRFANDMYNMGLSIGLSPEAAKTFAGQKALETSWGTILPADFNFGGIKARTGEKFKETMTTEDYGKGSVKLKQKFQSFESPSEYQQRVSELFQLPRYKGVMEAQTPEEYANALVRGGYATDKQYSQKLIDFYKNINKRLKPQGTPLP